jgi:HlyD family secretion protein
MKKALIGAVVVIAVVAGGVLLVTKKKESGPRFRKEAVARGSVVATVTATGTLSAVTTVKVGSQVSGIIARLHADFNSEVRKGQLLAELDPTPFQASVDQRRADVERARVELRNADLVLARARKLLDAQLQSQSEYDTARANRDGAAASVEQSSAALKQAETNLAYTRIVSPIDGVVVDRQYDVGQTVAASFQAPVLFTIAQDLTKMQVLTNIDEADIGKVKEGQEASFSVDAFPDRPFEGSVSQIRLSPQTVQNVVTYPVLLDVANPEGRLRPGMTANVQIPVDRRDDVLRVPNAALRFRPDPADLEGGGKKGAKAAGAEAGRRPDAKPAEGVGEKQPAEPTASAEGGRGDRASRGERRSGGGRPGGSGGAAGWPGRPGGARPAGAAREADVYVELPTGKLRAVHVRTSITDGNATAVETDELKEGDQVVLGLATVRAMSNGAQGGGPGRGMGRM